MFYITLINLFYNFNENRIKYSLVHYLYVVLQIHYRINQVYALFP